MYYGEQSKLVVLPDDLFTDPDGDQLTYSSTNYFEPNYLNIATTISKKEANILFIYVNSLSIGKSQISIVATDPYGLWNFLLVNVTIDPWASKDWIKWNGNLQSDWLEWIVGYQLDQRTGAWLEVFQYQSFILNSYFKILGFVTFLSILVPIFMSTFYGKITLYPILYIQIIIALLFSK